MRIWCCFLCFGDENNSNPNSHYQNYNKGNEIEGMENSNNSEAEKLEGQEGEEDGEKEESLSSSSSSSSSSSESCEEEEDLELGFYLGLQRQTSVGSKRDLEGCSIVERQKSVLEALELSIGGSTSNTSNCCLHHLPCLDDFGNGNVNQNGNGNGNVSSSSGVLDFGELPLRGVDFDWDLQFKRAKFDSSSQECHHATDGPPCADSNGLDVIGSHSSSQSSSVYSRNKSHYLPSSMESYVNNVSHNNSEDAEEECINNSDIDGMEIQMDLSDDLLHMVFSFLGHADLCRAAMVCKQWRTASAHEDFWRYLNFENRNISLAQLEDICHRYPRAIEVNLCGNSNMHMLVVRAVSLLRNLESLTLGKGQIGEAFFHAVSDCALLKTLIVCDAALGNGAQEISINHERLQQLQVTKCRVLRVFVRCPQLHTLSLKRSNMAHLGLNCPLLHELDIGSCHKLPDTAIRSAVTSCPLLESLDMSNCSSVSDETLRDIASVCANLHTLDASYCPNISLESVRMPLLTILKLESCEGITSASMTAIAYSNMLQVLELVNCSLLTSVSLDLPHMRNLRLVHCRKFVDLNLRCLMLSALTVSNCSALHRISITSNALKKLTLHKQESLNSLSLQCQYLEEVDLSDCESLTNSVCEVFSDGGGCPMLKSLVLDNCESLTAIELYSTSLVCLSLAGCRAITSLNLTCPYLDQVRLDGCDHLERASFLPVGLQSLNLGICPKLNDLLIEAPHMDCLELKGCGVLSKASINCPLLKSLDASFCSQLQDDCLSATTVSCPLIDKLILMSCPSIDFDGLSSLGRLENLTYLDLSYTFLMDLQPVFTSCLRLTVLKLQACKYLNDSSLEVLYKEGALPALRELDLSYGTLCQSAIEELLAYCTHLTHVSLNGCINMHDLNWGFTEPSTYQASSFSSQIMDEPSRLPHRLLQILNCVGCPNIKKVYIPSVAHCMHLSSLNVSLSVNLKEVDISCSNLCFLNLSNCSSLEILKLDCPKLSSLFLQSCSIEEEAVESAISGCNMLETLDVRFCPKIFSLGSFRAVCPSLKRIFNSLR